MEILEFGNMGRKKLILIHGFESPYQIWEKYIEHYKNDYHVIVPILPGHNPNESEEFVSLENCVTELENYYISRYGNQAYAIYGMSMGGVIASCIWKNRNIHIKQLILESSPLLRFEEVVVRFLTKQYLIITHKTQQRDRKTLRQAVNSMVTEAQLEDFLRLLDNISDSTIINYLREIGKFHLPANIATPDTQVTYYYGGKISEVMFGATARYIKKHYPQAKVICLKGKGHCEDALLNPEVRMKELDKILGTAKVS